MFGSFNSKAWSYDDNGCHSKPLFMFTLLNPSDHPPTKCPLKSFEYGSSEKNFVIIKNCDKNGCSIDLSDYVLPSKLGNKKLQLTDSDCVVEDIEVYTLYS